MTRRPLTGLFADDSDTAPLRIPICHIPPPHPNGTSSPPPTRPELPLDLYEPKEYHTPGRWLS